MEELKKYNIDNIYCINLKSRPDRWEIMTKRFDKAGLKVERFEAISPDDEISQKYIKATTRGTRGAVCCALSHIQVLKDALEKEYKSIIIFEDDVMILKNFIPELCELIKQKSNYDMIMLDGCNINFNMNKGIRLAKNNVLASGYLINRDTIKKILSYIGDRVDLRSPMYHVGSIFEVALIYIQSLGNSFITTPRLCLAEHKDSDIQTQSHIDRLRGFYERSYLPLYGDLYIK